MTWIIVLVVVVLLALWLVGQYNNLVRMRNNRENAFANIDVQLRQRYDLIPQLVATVKGYATHEKELLQRVTEARTAAMGATNINDKIAADNQLTGALAGLKVQLEAYPDLKANQNFMQLQTEIA
ncbi:MAG: LemA family protein, partial [Prevotella sp.]|nr:LemA family protein [Prevotella sp.]